MRLLHLRHQARRVMEPYQRVSAGQARRRYLQARVSRQWPISLVSKSASRRQARRKSPADGGTTIAIIGADGSGKTTMVDDTTSWLSGRIRIQTFYLGSARPSGATNAARLASKAARRAENGSRRVLGPGHRITRLSAGIADAVGAVRAVGDAWDRRARYRAGAAAARDGTVVLFDRFPIPGISLGRRHVDGPRIEAGSRRLLTRLALKERRLHSDVGRPDHVLALQVSPDIAVERKQPRDVEALRAKCRGIAGWQPETGLDVVRVDADAQLADVRRTVRRAVWRWL
jgi:thymidylate kinase